MAPDGTWSVDLTLTHPGSYRAITDFTAVVGGRQTPVTLGVDLDGAGDYRPRSRHPRRSPRRPLTVFFCRLVRRLRPGQPQPSRC